MHPTINLILNWQEAEKKNNNKTLFKALHLKYHSTEFAAVRQNTFDFICIFKHERLCETDTEDTGMIP